MTLVLIVFFNLYTLLVLYLVSKKKIDKPSMLRRILFFNDDYYHIQTTYMKRVVQNSSKPVIYGILFFNLSTIVLYLLYPDFKNSGDTIAWWLFIFSSMGSIGIQNIYSGKILKQIAIEENRELIIDFGNSYLKALLNWKLELGSVFIYGLVFSQQVRAFGFSQTVPFFTYETLLLSLPLLTYLYVITKNYHTEESYRSEIKSYNAVVTVYFLVKLIIVLGTIHEVTLNGFWEKTALTVFVGLFMCQIYHYTKNIHKLNVLFETKNA